MRHVGRTANDPYRKKVGNKRAHNLSLSVRPRDVKCDHARNVKTIWFNKAILKKYEHQHSLLLVVRLYAWQTNKTEISSQVKPKMTKPISRSSRANSPRDKEDSDF